MRVWYKSMVVAMCFFVGFRLLLLLCDWNKWVVVPLQEAHFSLVIVKGIFNSNHRDQTPCLTSFDKLYDALATPVLSLHATSSVPTHVGYPGYNISISAGTGHQCHIHLPCPFEKIVAMLILVFQHRYLLLTKQVSFCVWY
jgi:hypothetical protein